MGNRALAAAAVLSAVVVSLTSAGQVEDPVTTLCIRDVDGGEPTGDVTLALPERVVQADANYDTLPNVVDGFPSTCEVLLRWELSGTAGIFEVAQAEVFLDVTDPSRNGVYVLGLTRAWEAHTATWELAGEDGGSWAEPGALADGLDVEAQPYAHVVPLALGELRIELNEVGVAMVNDWITAVRPNHGLLLRSLNEVDSLTFANSSSVAPPRLELTQSDGGVLVSVGDGFLTDRQADTSICHPGKENLDFRGLVVSGPSVGPAVALLRFDTSQVPEGSVVRGARLELTGGGAPVQAQALLKPFDEQTANWTRASETQAWASAGAQGELDHDPTSLGEYTPEHERGSLTFNDAGVSVIQGWVDGADNFGLVLRPVSEKGISFFAERSAGDPLRRPALCLDLQPSGGLKLETCGCSSTGSALLGGVVLLAALRRRRRATPTG